MCSQQGPKTETKGCISFLYLVTTYSMVGFVVACSKEERLGKMQNVTYKRLRKTQNVT